MALLPLKDIRKPLMTHLLHAQPPPVWNASVFPQWLDGIASSFHQDAIPPPGVRDSDVLSFKDSELQAWAYWSLNRHLNPGIQVSPSRFMQSIRFDSASAQSLAHIALIREMILAASLYHLGKTEERSPILKLAITELPRLFRTTNPGIGLEIDEQGGGLSVIQISSHLHMDDKSGNFSISIFAVLEEFFEAVRLPHLRICEDCGIPFPSMLRARFCSWHCNHTVNERGKHRKNA